MEFGMRREGKKQSIARRLETGDLFLPRIGKGVESRDSGDTTACQKSIFSPEVRNFDGAHALLPCYAKRLNEGVVKRSHRNITRIRKAKCRKRGVGSEDHELWVTKRCKGEIRTGGRNFKCRRTLTHTAKVCLNGGDRVP
jgi:hypothetical protein